MHRVLKIKGWIQLYSYKYPRCLSKDKIDGSTVKSSVLIAIQILNYEYARGTREGKDSLSGGSGWLLNELVNRQRVSCCHSLLVVR